MATTVVLKPNATPTFGADWTIQGGSPNAHTALSDENGNTIIRTDTFDTAGRQVLLDFETYVLSASERCSRVRVRAVGYGITSSTYLFAEPGANGVFDLAGLAWMNNGVDASSNYYGAWRTEPPGAPTEWDQASLDSLRLSITHDSIGLAPHARVVEASFWIDIVRVPTASFIVPAYDGTVPQIPVLQWAYIGNGEAQTGYHVKVFTKAIAEAGGFDPETEATVAFDSGVKTGSATSVGVVSPFFSPLLSEGDEYYAYVKVAKKFNGVDWWGPWSTGRRFIVDDAPVTSVTGPADPVTDATRPVVTFTYTDTVGGSEKAAHELRVFAEPGGGWGGFDPDSAVGTHVYGIVRNDSSLSEQVGVDLVNGTNYRTYVRQQQNGLPQGLENLWGDWDYVEFDLTLATPAAPLLAVTPVVSNASVNLQLTQQENAVIPEYYQIERNDLLGLGDWKLVRGAEEIPRVAHGNVQVFVDYECPFYSAAVQYRARSVDTSLGQPVSTLTAAIACNLQVKNVWLKTLSSPPFFNKSFKVVDEWVVHTRTKIRSKKSALGRDKPYVISGDEDAISFGVTFLIQGESDWLFLEAILASTPLLYQSTKRNVWVELAGDVSEVDHLWDELHGEEGVRRVTVTFQEVDGPAV